MAENTATAEIAALGRLCGIAPEYCDNFGGRHPTSAATIEALLSAMGVPWQEPEKRRDELSRRRLGPWSRFLEPVHFLSPDSPGKINFYFLTPGAYLPSPLHLQAAIETDSGQCFDWHEEFSKPSDVASRQVQGGFRHRLELRLPWELPLGYYDLKLRVEAGGLAESGQTRLIVAPEQTYFPDCLRGRRRLWGFNLPLYALQSADNWGIGDFSDLQAVMEWAASLGASFVGVNPLHARSPLPEADPSPYAPISRLFYNFLYLDLEKAPELELCPEAQTLLAGPEFQARLARLKEGPLVPYPGVARLKRLVLELLFQSFWERHGPPEAPRTPRGWEFAAFLRDGGDALKGFGAFCALTEHFQQSDWRRWPGEYHHPDNAAVADFARERQQDVRLHQYAQWLAAAQLQQVGAAARRRRLPVTLYQDLALGADAGGFDTWAFPDLFARGAAIGAPPDAFSPRGQNWGIPPIIPAALRESGYQLFIDTIRANSPEGGILRLDHVMGLFRLLWIPTGMEAAGGAYVHYRARELLAVLALESVRRRTLIIGEDLGTVSPRVRRDLGRLGVFSYRVFYFERDPEGRFLPPEHYPSQAVAAVTTHDLPTLTGFWQGRDQTFRREANLYLDRHQAETDAAQRQRDHLKLVETLKNRGLLPEDAELPADPAAPCPPQVREGVLEYLAQSRAALLEVRLEEIFGWPWQQNFPGTNIEHPNWRGRIPPTLEEMARDPAPPRLAARLNKHRGT
jgi:4-alpha-glucanotransferase